MADRTLRINVKVDADRAVNQLGRVNRAIGGTGARTGPAAGIAGNSAAASAGLLAIARNAAGVVAVADVFRRVVTTAVSMNSQLETSTLQFESLGFSAEGARSHVESLFTFAQRTPFETRPIIEASRLMQTLGGDSLNTMQNLTLVGNAAAASSRGIEEVAFWTGRMVATLQSGSPAIGESTARLLEMGVISGQGRVELEELAKSGASTTEVFAAFQRQLEEFGPAMEKQAETFTGLTSSLTDNVSILIGQLGSPVFNAFKGVIAATNEEVSTINTSIEAATEFNELLWEVIEGQEGAWGELAQAVSMTSDEFVDARRDARLLEGRIRDLERAVEDDADALQRRLLPATTSAEDALKAFEETSKRVTRETEEMREAQEEATRQQEVFRESVTNLGTVADRHIRSISMWEVRLAQLEARHRSLAAEIDRTTGKVRLQSRAIEELDDMMTQRIQPTLENQKGIMESFRDDAVGIFSEIFGSGGSLSGLLNVFSSDAGDIMGRLFGGAGTPGSLANMAVEGLAMLADSVVPGLGNVVRLFAQWGEQLWNAVSGFFRRIWDGLVSIGREFGNLIGSIPGFGGLTPTHESPFPGIPGQDPGDEGATAVTGPIVPMARGGFGTVTRPTLFLAGERGPEQFAFSGGGRSFGASTVLNLTFNGFTGSFRDAERVTAMVERTINRQLGDRRIVAGVV